MIQLFAHPFSSYCWKAMIVFHEKDVPYELRLLDQDQPGNGAEFARRWPMQMMPLLVDGDTQVMETSAIIEWLDVRFPQPRMIPADPEVAVEVRMMDRVFDNYVMTPMQRIVADAIRLPEERDRRGVADARAMLDASYAWLDERMREREWAAADAFTLADCAAAPSLFYADWTHPIGADYPKVGAYRARLLARPSYARAVDEARRFRHVFPLGAPAGD